MKKNFTTILIAFALIFFGLNAQAQVPQLWGISSNVQEIRPFHINGDGTGFTASDTIFCNSYTNNYAAGELYLANNGKLYGFSTGFTNYSFLIDPVNFTHTVFDSINGGGGTFSQAANGNLYYASNTYGGLPPGNIYRLDLATNTLLDVYDFNSNIGVEIIHGQFVSASNGLLYASIAGGGQNNMGFIYSFNPANNAFTELYSYTNANRFCDFMIQNNNGLLYGMTRDDYSASGSGTIFSFDISTNTYTDLHTFDSLTGWQPEGKLLDAGNGILYGITNLGGANNLGVNFKYNVNTNVYTDIHDFSFLTGCFGNVIPGNLMLASNGKIYGCTSAGGDTVNYPNSTGVIFSIDTATNVYTAYNVLNGWQPRTGLVELSPNSACNAAFTLHADTSQAHYYIGYNNSTGTGTLHYWWSWGDNTYDSTQFPSHVYADSGYYTICLTIADTTGCSSSYCDDSLFLNRTTNAIVYLNIVGTTLGINNIAEQPNVIRVFPNPATNTLNIQTSISIVGYQLSIEDIMGNKIHQQVITGFNTNIDVSKWSEGIYFYEISNSNNISRGKFVIQK